jgi:hypothetical protein
VNATWVLSWRFRVELEVDAITRRPIAIDRRARSLLPMLHGGPAAPPVRWRSIAAWTLAAIVATAVGVWILLPSSNEILGPIRGVRLGLSPSQVRRQLETDGPGSFRSIAMGEDFALVWMPDRPRGDLLRARLEFHLGQLVAARMLLSPRASESGGPALSQSEASVLHRRTTSRGVELTWIAKSCPTHAAEVRRLLSRRT